MKLTVEKLYAVVEGLNSLVERELPISAAFSIQRNINKATAELESSDKLRDKIIKKYASEVKEDGSADIPQENVADFQKEYEELMAYEIEAELEPIRKSQLGETITPKAIMQLLPLLTDEEEEEEE